MAETPAWKIKQPPVADMMFPVRCVHCSQIYDIGFVLVTARLTDCSVWTSPCCGCPSIDDRPWMRDRHYRKLTRDEALGNTVDFYDMFGMRHRY